MEIRHKLTLQFSLLVAFLLLAILSFNFLLAFRFAKESFHDRLEEKSISIVNNYLGNKELQNNERFPLLNHFLPSEVILLYDESGNQIFRYGNDEWKPEPGLLEELRSRTNIEKEQSSRYILGRTLESEGKKQFLIGSAVDVVGSSKLKNMAWSMLLSFMLFLGFSVLSGFFLSKKALEPIQSVIDQVNMITAMNLNKRVSHENNKDEIAQLSNTFNSMLERLELSFKTQTDFVRNSSHELRNPLAAMIGQAEIALNRDRDARYYKEVVQTMFQESLRLKHIVNSLLQLSKASPETVSKFHEILRLDELVFDVVENLTRTDPRCRIEVSMNNFLEREALVNVNRSLIEIALGNLLENACKYSGYSIVKCGLHDNEKKFRLVVEDKGIGMTEEEIQRISEPFYRSDKVRSKEGFGIGMAVASRVFQVHGIEMLIRSSTGIGTTIELIFPEQLPPRPLGAEG